MLKAIRTRLAVRSAVAILLLVSALGLMVLVLSLGIVYQGEGNRQQRQLDTLLDTVASTAQIAAFLADRELAREVVQGLQGNDIVEAVALYADRQLLAQSGYENVRETLERELPLNGAVLQRPIRSPFDVNEVVGVIYLLPNHALMRQTVLRSALVVALVLTFLTIMVAAGTVWVVVRFVTRPIATVSASLHRLKVESGERLRVPRRNADDELGLLVGDVNRMIERLVDIIGSERALRHERELRERRYRTIFEKAETGIFLIREDGVISSCNPAFRRSFRLAPDMPDDQEPLNLFTLLPSQAQQLRHLVQQCRDGQRAAEAELAVGISPDRSWLHVTLNDVGDGLYQGVVNDITARTLAQQEAEHRAVTDPLTGVGNRAGFETRLARLVSHQHDGGSHFALLMMDLDRFKEANDTFGHPVGDRVLQLVADMLRRISRKTDYPARLGGDEFVLLLSDIADRSAVEQVAARLVEEVSMPMAIDAGVVVHVSASIGVAYSTADEPGADLIHRADTALYEAKRRGRNRYCVAS